MILNCKTCEYYNYLRMYNNINEPCFWEDPKGRCMLAPDYLIKSSLGTPKYKVNIKKEDLGNSRSTHAELLEQFNTIYNKFLAEISAKAPNK